MIHQTMSEGMTHTQEDLLMVPFSLWPGEDSRNMGARWRQWKYKGLGISKKHIRNPHDEKGHRGGLNHGDSEHRNLWFTDHSSPHLDPASSPMSLKRVSYSPLADFFGCYILHLEIATYYSKTTFCQKKIQRKINYNLTVPLFFDIKLYGDIDVRKCV